VSLRRRLTVAAAAAAAVAVAGVSAAAYLPLRSQLRHEVDVSLQRGAAAIHLEGDTEGQEHLVEGRELGETAAYVQLVDESGAVVQPVGEKGSLPVSDRALQVAAGRSKAYLSDAHVGGVHLRVLTRPIGDGTAVQLARPLTEVDNVLRRFAVLLAALAAAGVAAAALLGRLAARPALAPVTDLTRAAEEVARTKDLAHRIDTPGRDELARLAAAFNDMLAALDESLAAQRRLVADASHELRTPLTSLRTNVEVLAADAGRLSDPDRARLAHDITQQIEELTDLVADLVELGRGAEPTAATEPLGLDELVDGAVERMARHYPTVTYVTDLEPCRVRGVADRLDRAVTNLLDNAGKWSPPGARVDVRVTARGEVCVRDRGPGIAAEDLPHVFERFYRSSAARGQPGSGLGLAIVEQVAREHGGSARAELADGGGTIVRLLLPPIG
jgi:two-component system sensor histidine kinase MprB